MQKHLLQATFGLCNLSIIFTEGFYFEKLSKFRDGIDTEEDILIDKFLPLFFNTYEILPGC